MKPKIAIMASMLTFLACFQWPAFAQSNSRADQSNQRAQDRYNDYMRKQREKSDTRDQKGDSNQRAPDKYNDYIRKQREQLETDNKSFELQTSLEAKLDEIPIRVESDGEVREFCQTKLQLSDLSPVGRASLGHACQQKIAAIQQKKNEQAEKNKERDSAAAVDALVLQLKDMPPNEETIRELRRLKNGGYRLPNLTWSAQNRYFEEIGRALGKLDAVLTDQACEEVAAKAKVPPKLRDAIILDGLGGVSLTQFLCGAIVSSNNVTAVAAESYLQFNADDLSMRFDIVRYLKEQRVAVPQNSPLEGGVIALSLASATINGRDVDLRNPNAFVVNVYSQWTPQLAAFLAQTRK